MASSTIALKLTPPRQILLKAVAYRLARMLKIDVKAANNVVLKGKFVRRRAGDVERPIMGTDPLGRLLRGI